jgi:hypothetical protein
MAKQIWRGGAVGVAQVVNLTPAAPQIGDTFTVTVNNKSVTYTAAAATVADVVSGLQALLAASTIPEFLEVSWTADSALSKVIGTAAVAGAPFTASASRVQSGALSAPSGLAAVPAVANGSLTNGTTYYYKVTALTALGETSPSAEVSATATSTGAITFSWSAVTGATGYKVYRGTSSGGETYLVTVPVNNYTDFGTPALGTASPPSSNTAAIAVPSLTSATSDTIAGSVPAGTYFYKITAITALGETTVSQERSATLASTGEIVLVWVAVTGATGYKVYRGTVTNTQNKLVTTTGAVTTFTDQTASPPTGIPPSTNGAYVAIPTGTSAAAAGSGNGSLTSGTEYFWKVTATNAAGETTASAEAQCYATSTGAVALSWSAVANATGYNVYRGTTSGTDNFVQSLGAVTSFTDYGTIATTSATPPGGNTTASASTFTLSTPTASAGPNDWSTAANWSTGSVPVNSDDVYLTNTSNAILYGLNQSGVSLNSINSDSTFTGTCGLPLSNPNGYVEYRPRYLQVGFTTLNHGAGTGSGSGRVLLDGGTVQWTANVFSTGSPADQGVPALVLKGTNAGNVLNVQQGTVGVATDAGDVSTVATIRIGSQQSQQTDVNLTLGDGCTLTTISQYGGQLFFADNVTTLTMFGGTATALEAAAVGTLSLQKGATYYHESSGTITTATVGGSARLDFSRDPRARTVTNLTVAAGGTLVDSNKTVTFTNPFLLQNCTLNDVTLDLGANFNLQRS